MDNKILSSLLLSISMLSGCAFTKINKENSKDATVVEPTLVSFAQLDVETYADGPESGHHVLSANGINSPFKAQPIQGFSAGLKNTDGTYLLMSDNGFCTQENSADYLLRLYAVDVNFRKKH